MRFWLDFDKPADVERRSFVGRFFVYLFIILSSAGFFSPDENMYTIFYNLIWFKYVENFQTNNNTRVQL